MLMLLLLAVAGSQIPIFVVTRSPLTGVPPGRAKHQLGIFRPWRVATRGNQVGMVPNDGC